MNSFIRPRASLSLEPLQNLKVALVDGAEADFLVPRARRILIPQPAEEKKREEGESEKGNRKLKRREKARTYHFKVSIWPPEAAEQKLPTSNS